MKLKNSGFLFCTLLFSGCIGWNLPQPLSNKPYTYFKGGDQLGRDQLANRALVGEMRVKINGRDKNEVLSFFGQPQEIEITERNVSEDWHFLYYKKYIPYNPMNKVHPPSDEGEFIVRIYRDKVIDVIHVS